MGVYVSLCMSSYGMSSYVMSYVISKTCLHIILKNLKKEKRNRNIIANLWYTLAVGPSKDLIGPIQTPYDGPYQSII